jgi:hypothetical protein
MYLIECWHHLGVWVWLHLRAWNLGLLKAGSDRICVDFSSICRDKFSILPHTTFIVLRLQKYKNKSNF